MNENNKKNHTTEDSLQGIKSHVLEQIESGKINMKPKFYYLLKVISLVVVGCFTLLISSFLVSFIVFSIVESGKLFLLGFGVRGFWIFLILFPWRLLIIEIAFVVLLQWLIKKFRFGYRSSFTTLILFILCISLLISIAIIITPLHRSLLQQAEHRNLPLVGDYYRGLHRPPPGEEIFRGTVSSVSTSSFVLLENEDADATSSETYTVILPPAMIHGADFKVGDSVFVAGQQFPDQQIRAYGIKKLPLNNNK